MKKTIAIFGATGHVGKILIYYFSQIEGYQLICLVRNEKKMERFLIDNNINTKNVGINNITNCIEMRYDVLINCLGFGDPNNLEYNPGEFFRLTEFYDNLIIDYLLENKDCIYIFFSSGGIYGNNFFECANSLSSINIKINHVTSRDYYTILKLNAEIKHRAFDNLNIIDLRLFALYSRFIDLSYRFFMSELVNCIRDNKVFITDHNDFIRDFINPLDLVRIVETFFNNVNLNDSFDIYSSDPISKLEIISIFSKKYNLKYEFIDQKSFVSPTGFKKNYYSRYKKLNKLGYIPKYSSKETLIKETEILLSKNL